MDAAGKLTHCSSAKQPTVSAAAEKTGREGFSPMRPPANTLKLLGQRFGRLRVISRAGSNTAAREVAA
jgi:hypothetical protein